jgi:ubiquinone/menaquinone biosynthesis C-methylase UbiE
MARDATPKVSSSVTGLPTLGQGDERSTWFWTHYRDAADTTIRTLAHGGVDMKGKRVADVGSGDGIIDLALVLKAAPAELVGFDLAPADTAKLLDDARREGVAAQLPPELRFEVSHPTSLPAEDNTFDVVLSWSAFEHIADPPAVMREIARVLRPDGVFILQLWPFYHSEHGSHLWQWFPEGFPQFRYSDEQIERHVRADDSNRALAELLLNEYGRLNKATLDDLGAAIRFAGMRVARLEPMAGPVVVPAEAADIPLSQLAISGVILLAIPASTQAPSSLSNSFLETGVFPQPPIELAGRVGGRYEDLLDIAAAHRRHIDELLPKDWTYRDKSVLDFGCGVGRTMAAYYDLVDQTEIVGCDIHRPSIEWAAQAMSPPFEFFVCDEEPPLDQPDERFDLIYACSVFSHLTDGWARWLVELHRVLRPGGILIASILNRPMIEPIFGREWDDRIGMAPAFLGRHWDAGGPCVLLSEWWVREHWGRAFDILRFDEGVQSEGTLVGHGWVVGRRREGEPTADALEDTDLDDPREQGALMYNLEVLSSEARSLGEQLTNADFERSRLKAAIGAMEGQLEGAQSMIDAFASSRSWRFTAPLRRAADTVRPRRAR